jgi:hypothetical protein
MVVPLLIKFYGARSTETSRRGYLPIRCAVWTNEHVCARDGVRDAFPIKCARRDRRLGGGRGYGAAEHGMLQ